MQIFTYTHVHECTRAYTHTHPLTHTWAWVVTALRNDEVVLNLDYNADNMNLYMF